jgi:N-acetylglutamate synthase
MDLTLIAALEDAAFRALPAAELMELGGWQLRATPGLATKRANSVLARDHADSDELAGKLDGVERFYAGRRLPARFQLCPASRPAGLADALRERGYETLAPTAVHLAPLEHAGPATAAPTTAAATAVAITGRPTEAWWRTWRAALGLGPERPPHVAGLFARIDQETAFAVVSLDGEEVAVGLGVRDGPRLGIYNMATRPEHRRRGGADVVLGALMRWGHGRGATTAYLQVQLDNAPALALYSRAHFREAYRYRYLTRGA